MSRGDLILIGGLVAAASVPVLGQVRTEPDAFYNQQRAIEERVQQEADAQLPATQDIDFDYGGWYSFHLFIYDDGVESSRTYRRNDLYTWSRLSLDKGAHSFYVRGRLSYLDFNSGDSYDGNDSDWWGPNLERGFYQFNLRRAMQAYAGKYTDYDLTFKIGRDLATFGTGFAMSTLLDQVWLQAEYKNFLVTGLMGNTVGSNAPLDTSRPASRERRTFFGAEARYIGFERHRPFAYVLWQRDHNSDVIPTPFQDFNYDSFYAGLGSEGEIVENLAYSTEWVFESGHSYGNGQWRKTDDIRAWAFDVELEYLFDAKSKPRASVEYMFASGDGNRFGSPTNAIGGTVGSYRDSSFNGFGWRDTGLSFAPSLSNIHIWRTGGSFYPFEDHAWFKHFQLGSDWFLYYKNHRSGAVSDATANEASGYLGWEMDYYANLDITPDLAWTARYGIFFPGKAFSDQTTRTFFLVGMTWRF